MAYEFGHNRETYSLIMGVILLFSGILFFGLRLNVLNISTEITDEQFLMFFASMAIISAVIHFLSTIDF
jgi:hypothetical protein